jgi:adenylate cyclase
MAVFGTPIAREDHAQTAFDAAEEMLRVRLPRVNAWLREQGLPAFRLGVGLNTGPVMSGTVGSERRLEYAAIGDTTNVAARLEAMTKETNGGLMLSESTRSGLSRGGEELERRGELPVRGRAEPIVVWLMPLDREPAEAVEREPATA